MSELKKYWHNLSSRDQKFLRTGALLVLIILFYSLVWAPVQSNLKRLRTQVVSQSADLVWMQQQATEIRKLNKNRPVNSAKPALPLLTVVDQTAKILKIRDRIKQIQPGKENGTAKVWFDKVVFEDWLKWLDMISARGIDVTRVSVTKSGEFPKVNIRLELSI